MSMLEESVAEAMFVAATARARAESAHVCAWADVAPYFRQHFLTMARAAIEVVRSVGSPQQLCGRAQGGGVADAHGSVALADVDDVLPPPLWNDGALEVAASAAEHLPPVGERDEFADGMPELIPHVGSVDATPDPRGGVA